MIIAFRDRDGDTRLVNVASARSVLVRLPHDDDDPDELAEYVHVQWHTAIAAEAIVAAIREPVRVSVAPMAGDLSPMGEALRRATEDDSLTTTRGRRP